MSCLLSFSVAIIASADGVGSGRFMSTLLDFC